tara:strand:+ start:1166 stop:1291 length:126 start_codon:yes stop_codon:yes gene_type:complete
MDQAIALKRVVTIMNGTPEESVGIINLSLARFLAFFEAPDF